MLFILFLLITPFRKTNAVVLAQALKKGFAEATAPATTGDLSERGDLSLQSYRRSDVMKRIGWIRPPIGGCNVDEELLERSRAARFGRRLMDLALVIRVVEPALIALIAAVVLATPALAQPGGNIFGGNDQAIGNGVREAIRWGRNLLFLLGVAGVGWATFNLMTEKAWGRQMMGGLLCLGFGGVVSLIYSFSQGNAVNLDTNLGN
jgi:hypothetical protein